jgi:hypothetical protein
MGDPLASPSAAAGNFDDLRISQQVAKCVLRIKDASTLQGDAGAHCQNPNIDIGAPDAVATRSAAGGAASRIGPKMLNVNGSR